MEHFEFMVFLNGNEVGNGTLTQCKKIAKKVSKENPDDDVTICCIGVIEYANGKEKELYGTY